MYARSSVSHVYTTQLRSPHSVNTKHSHTRLGHFPPWHGAAGTVSCWDHLSLCNDKSRLQPFHSDLDSGELPRRHPHIARCSAAAVPANRFSWRSQRAQVFTLYVSSVYGGQTRIISCVTASRATGQACLTQSQLDRQEEDHRIVARTARGTREVSSCRVTASLAATGHPTQQF